MRLALPLFLAAALCLPAAAAVGPAVEGLRVCGRGSCTALSTATLEGLLAFPTALRAVRPAPVQEFHAFRAGSRTVFYVRDGRRTLLRFPGAGSWRLVPLDDAALLRDAVAATLPFPPPALRGVRVGTRTMQAPAALLRLFDGAVPAPRPPHAPASRLVVAPDRANPWFDPNEEIRFYSGAGVVVVGGT
ncbi:MAG TPA: hypothetical protein VJ689_12905, partial [Gaiellaceae bacterium]|nr:hypothetical protein [Gaiellaceae bacterium]